VKIIAFGECMIEVSGALGGAGHVGFGGDTFNTAVYLARASLDVAYATALGTDPLSTTMRAAWQKEGIDTSLVLNDPDHVPGLYHISVDAKGERSFTYWRSQSAARQFFALPQAQSAMAQMATANVLFLSGITLSLFDEAGQAKIVALAKAVLDKGGHVAFDPNYRPRGWASPDHARAAISALAPYVSIALTGVDDEAALFGNSDFSAIVDRWHQAQVVVIKQGEDGAHIMAHGVKSFAPAYPAKSVVDTTGAGDSYNAGFLAAYLTGSSAEEAGYHAAKLAAQVVAHKGAIIPRT
jgi:2-dehydro-3-deoxygluconokinase